MSDPVSIPLHGRPGVSVPALARTIVGANLLVLGLSAVFFGLIPFLTEDKPEIGLAEWIAMGVALVVVMIAAIGWNLRQQFQRGFGHPIADLTREGDRVVLRRRDGGTVVEVDVEELQVRPVSVQDSVSGGEYYVGPGLEFMLDGESRVVAVLDGTRRWAYDPPTASNIVWICPSDRFNELARTCGITTELVDYVD